MTVEKKPFPDQRETFRRPISIRRHLAIALLAFCAAANPAAADQSSGDDEVITPKETITLFNGQNFSNFYTWLVDSHREDPQRVFSVVDRVDGAPAIRISGQVYGGLTTKKRYANYRLVAEFRWGLLTWGNRTNATKDAGILLHCQGRDGAYFSKDFNGPWMRSYEFQIIEGGVGDILVLGSYEPDGSVTKYHLTATVTKDRDGEPCWDARGEPKIYETGRINWWGRDPDWVDKLGFRGKQDVESPDGQWTRIEVVCAGDKLEYFVNGKLVNKASQLSNTNGKLIFQSEGAEIFFRRIELHPLTSAK
jgi:hypothetical protein